jgi:23S rRNA pseudouridine955/2504/2580 synthase
VTDQELTFDPDWILFQGSGLLAVDKPAGIPAHAGTGHDVGLAESVDAWVRMNPGVLEIKPGRPVHPVHRLDLEASGVLLLALSKEKARSLHAAFETRRVKKRYLAFVAGPVDALGRLEGTVRSRLRGVYRQLPSQLGFRRIRGDERLSLVEVLPEEGRTHQIRELFAKAGRPLAGDLRFGRPTPSRQFLATFEVPGLLLHALEVVLPEEILGAPKTIRAALPETFHKVVAKKGWDPLKDEI